MRSALQHSLNFLSLSERMWAASPAVHAGGWGLGGWVGGGVQRVRGVEGIRFGSDVILQEGLYLDSSLSTPPIVAPALINI